LIQVLKLSVTLFIPAATQLISECFVSLKRVEDFLSLPNLDQTSRLNPELFEREAEDTLIKMQSASFSWDTKENVILNDLDLTIKKGSLTCICGPVGSGKTSLLNAILGDMKLVSGKVGIRSQKIAYVSQTPWIMSGTIKDSILFGQEYDP
jgi:ABC-type multidrug transport system fused ATPase/permease subunit